MGYSTKKAPPPPLSTFSQCSMNQLYAQKNKCPSAVKDADKGRLHCLFDVKTSNCKVVTEEILKDFCNKPSDPTDASNQLENWEQCELDAYPADACCTEKCVFDNSLECWKIENTGQGASEIILEFTLETMLTSDELNALDVTNLEALKIIDRCEVFMPVLFGTSVQFDKQAEEYEAHEAAGYSVTVNEKTVSGECMSIAFPGFPRKLVEIKWAMNSPPETEGKQIHEAVWNKADEAQVVDVTLLDTSIKVKFKSSKAKGIPVGFQGHYRKCAGHDDWTLMRWSPDILDDQVVEDLRFFSGKTNQDLIGLNLVLSQVQGNFANSCRGELDYCKGTTSTSLPTAISISGAQVLRTDATINHISVNNIIDLNVQYIRSQQDDCWDGYPYYVNDYLRVSYDILDEKWKIGDIGKGGWYFAECQESTGHPEVDLLKCVAGDWKTINPHETREVDGLYGKEAEYIGTWQNDAGMTLATASVTPGEVPNESPDVEPEDPAPTTACSYGQLGDLVFPFNDCHSLIGLGSVGMECEGGKGTLKHYPRTECKGSSSPLEPSSLGLFGTRVSIKNCGAQPCESFSSKLDIEKVMSGLGNGGCSSSASSMPMALDACFETAEGKWRKFTQCTEGDANGKVMVTTYDDSGCSVNPELSSSKDTSIDLHDECITCSVEQEPGGAGAGGASIAVETKSPTKAPVEQVPEKTETPEGSTVTNSEETVFSGDFKTLMEDPILDNRRRLSAGDALCDPFMEVLFPGWPESEDIPDDVVVKCNEVDIEPNEATVKWDETSQNPAALEKIERMVKEKVEGTATFSINVKGETVTVKVTSTKTTKTTVVAEKTGTTAAPEQETPAGGAKAGDKSWSALKMALVIGGVSAGVLLLVGIGYFVYRRSQERARDAHDREAVPVEQPDCEDADVEKGMGRAKHSDHQIEMADDRPVTRKL